jgi:5-methylcytosine-specific restriction enzyme A
MVSAYLLTWNPAKFPWRPKEIVALAKQSSSGTPCEFEWSCSRSKKLTRGDRAFLTKLGKEGRGIFASGWITRGSYPVERDSDFGPEYVDVERDVFLDPRLDESLLDPTILPGNQHWTPESSGISIRPEIRDALELLWAKHLTALKQFPNPRNIPEGELYDSFELEGAEGQLKKRIVNHRRRERSLRNAKIVDYRRVHSCLRCEVCGYDFMEHFGVDYAEVHHLKPLGLSGKTTTKLSDLAVLCANCHRVAHLEAKRPKSLVELKTMNESFAVERSALSSTPKNLGVTDFRKNADSAVRNLDTPDTCNQLARRELTKYDEPAVTVFLWTRMIQGNRRYT